MGRLGRYGGGSLGEERVLGQRARGLLGGPVATVDGLHERVEHEGKVRLMPRRKTRREDERHAASDDGLHADAG